MEKALLDAAMNVADTMLAFLDRDFRILAVTPTYARACRLPARDLVGADFFTLVPKPWVRRLFLRARATGRPTFRHNRAHVYPGSPPTEVTYWDWSLTPARDDAGRVVGFIHAMRETTRHRRAEQKARQSEERLRMALESVGMVTWEWDLRTGAIQYSGNAPDMARGADLRPYIDLDRFMNTIHPDDRAATRRALDRAMSKGLLFDVEYRVRMLDGKYHWIHNRGKAVVKERGRPVRAYGVSQEVTERKEAEIKLQLRTRQLAQLASDLTVAEHRERRRLADLLHEGLQQLLFAAMMQVESLREQQDTRGRPEFDTLYRAIKESLSSARAVTRGLAAPVLPNKDLSLAFQWLVLDMQERHRLKVDLVVRPACAPTTEATSVLLFTAARELLMNIVKHAGTRRAELRVDCVPKGIELTVRDRGRGMRPGTLDSPLNHRGFGLFSIRERAELLGGTMTVRSAPRRGTCVTLRLPLSPAEAV